MWARGIAVALLMAIAGAIIAPSLFFVDTEDEPRRRAQTLLLLCGNPSDRWDDFVSCAAKYHLNVNGLGLWTVTYKAREQQPRSQSTSESSRH